VIYPTYTSSGLTPEEITFISLNTMIDTTNNGFSLDIPAKTITFLDLSIATVPENFPALTKEDFQVFINGQNVEPSAITSIAEVGLNVVITFNNNLNFALEVGMEFTIVGKLNVL